MRRSSVEFTLEPEIIGEAKLGYDEVHNPEMFQPHLGVDESGKGDFFGPLVIAGVYTDGDLPRQLLDLGVKDSKQITSDKKALEIADAIKELVTLDRFNVIVISPEKYNELYVKISQPEPAAGVGPCHGDREFADALAEMSAGALG